MREKKRKNFSSQFKAKVALGAIRGVKTVNEISQEFGVHPTQDGLWKKELQALSISACFFRWPCEEMVERARQMLNADGDGSGVL